MTYERSFYVRPVRYSSGVAFEHRTSLQYWWPSAASHSEMRPLLSVTTSSGRTATVPRHLRRPSVLVRVLEGIKSLFVPDECVHADEVCHDQPAGDSRGVGSDGLVRTRFRRL